MANYSQMGEYRPLFCVSKHPQCKVGTDAICVPCQDQHQNNIRNLLAAQGSLIGKFHQLKFNDATANRKTISSSIGLRTLGGGYCAGVALDWVRRVLLSAENRDAAYLNYNFEGIVDGKESNLAGHTRQDAKARGTQTLNRMAKVYAVEPDNRWLRNRTTQETTLDPGLWDKNMQAIESSRGPGKKKPFTSITLVASDRTAYEGADQWRAALLGGNTGGGVIPAGHAARLDFSPSNGQAAGHAVAVWRRRENQTQTDSFYLFDPSLGVFSFAAGGLDSALSVLFAYQNGDVPFNDDSVSPEGAVVAYYVFKPATGATESGQQQVQLPSTGQAKQPAVQPVVQPMVQPLAQPSTQPTPQPKPQPSPQPTPQPSTQPRPQVTQQSAPQQTPSLYGGQAQQGLMTPGNSRPSPQTVQLPSQPKPVLAQPTPTGHQRQDFTNWLTDQFVDKYNGTAGGWVQLSEPQAEQVRTALRSQIKGLDKERVVQDRVVKGRLVGPGRQPYAILKSHLDEVVKKTT